MGTRVTEVLPRRVEVVSGQRVRVTVRGNVWGFVVCDGQWRTSWGRFEEAFLVDPRRVTSLRLWGVGGSVRQQLRFDVKRELKVPEAPAGQLERMPRLATALLPRLEPPRYRAVHVPHLAVRAPRVCLPRPDERREEAKP